MPTPLPPVDVFSSNDNLFDRLVAVTNEALYTANPDKPQVAGLAAQVKSAGPAVMSGMAEAQEIPFKRIKSVEANRHRTDMNVYYHDGSKDRMKHVDFESAAARDKVFESLRRRLGRQFVKDEVQYGLGRAMLAPIVSIVVFGGITWFLMGAAREIDEGVEVNIQGRQALLKRLFVLVLDILGPTGVAIVGGLIVAGCAAWLVGRMKNPPLMATLTAKR